MNPTLKTKSNNGLDVYKPPIWATLALGTALLTAAIAAHFPATYAGYIWDDGLFLFRSPLITMPDGIYRAWFTTQGTDYWPLMSTMFWIEWRLWGNNPMPYHVVNIVLHAMAVVLLWRLLKRLKLAEPGAYLAALLFAIHPVTVESVAWIAERKNVLSLTIYLLAILTYLKFEDRNSRAWYVLAIFVAAAAILAKSSAVMLPFALLLCAWWRRNLITRQDIIRSLPFFALSLVLGLIEVWFVHNQAVREELGRPEGLASRIAAVGWIYWFYLYKLIVPVNLIMVYPRWQVDPRQLVSFVPLIVLVACLIILWHYRKSWGRGPLAAMAYFVVTLLPVVGLLNMQFNRYSLVADHLQYPGMPSILALIACGIAGVWSWARRRNNHAVAGVIAATTAAISITLGILTWQQAKVYRDEITLWSHTVAINDLAFVGHNNLGSALHKQNKLDKAIAALTKSLTLKPNFSGAYYNRGNAYRAKGDYDRALQDYCTAIQLQPNLSEAFNNRGTIYSAQGKLDEELKDFTRAIELKSDNIEAYFNRGVAYSKSSDHHRAIVDFDRVLQLWPSYAPAYAGRANEYYMIQQYDKAWTDVKICRHLGGSINPRLLQNLAEASGRAE